MQNNKQAAGKLKTQNPDQTHTGTRSSYCQGSPQSWYEEDSRVTAHWYSPYKRSWVQTESSTWCGVPADETPTDPSANDLDLGVPTACQIGSTVVLPKNPKTKNRREKQKRTQEVDPREADPYKRVDEASHNSLS